MKGLAVFGIVIATIVVCVLSESDQPAAAEEISDVAVRADQLAHVRSKRSPHDALIPSLLLGKSFLIGALVGKSLRKGWGWRPRPVRGWGWRRPAPVVVHHHSHGGWGEPVISHGWGEPVVASGWGWAR